MKKEIKWDYDWYEEDECEHSYIVTYVHRWGCLARTCMLCGNVEKIELQSF